MAEDELCNARVYDDAGFVGGWGKERDRVCVCVCMGCCMSYVFVRVYS